MNGAQGRAQGGLRLRVLNALPPRHQEYFFEQIRERCRRFVARTKVPAADREADVRELLSEVMARFLGVGGSGGGSVEASDFCGDLMAHRLVHPDDPKRDGRVAWLLSELDGQWTIAHRAEDIRRRLHGRWRDGGYRDTQLDETHIEKATFDPDDPLAEADAERIWRGLLAAAARQFGPTDDVSMVLDLLANDADLKEAFGSAWPIKDIVALLNKIHPDTAWTDDRVDNAKRRIKKWIVREMRDRGLDTTGLRDFFARCAPRQAPSGDALVRTAPRRMSK